MGSAALVERTIESLQRRGSNELKRIFIEDPTWTELGLKAFKIRLKNAERDAVRCWLEIWGVIEGDQSKALLAWLSAQGVVNAELAQQMIALAKRAMESSDTDAYRLAKQLVRARVMADPDERRRVMQEIFGAMEVPASMTNGHANGAHA